MHSEREYRDSEWLLSAERNAIVADQLVKYLPASGLKQIHPLKWVDGSNPPVRRVFQMRLMKGASMNAAWGFSLDFVPHISGKTLRWHRTDETAMLDIIVDPYKSRDFCSLFGAASLTNDLEKFLPAAINSATETWARGTSWQGLLDIIIDIRDKRTNEHGYDNYTQLPLAFAFVSAKIGNILEAESELGRYAAQRNEG